MKSEDLKVSNCLYCGKTADRICPAAPKLIISSIQTDTRICSVCCGSNRLLYFDCPVTCQYVQAAPKYWLKKYKFTKDDLESLKQYLDVLSIVGSVVIYMKRTEIHKDGFINDNVREALANLFITFEKALDGVIYQEKVVNFRVTELIATLSREFAKFKDYKLTPKEQSPTKYIYNGLKFLIKIYPRYNIDDSFFHFLSLFKWYKIDKNSVLIGK